jgi:hypothetical protein
MKSREMTPWRALQAGRPFSLPPSPHSHLAIALILQKYKKAPKVKEVKVPKVKVPKVKVVKVKKVKYADEAGEAAPKVR